MQQREGDSRKSNCACGDWLEQLIHIIIELEVRYDTVISSDPEKLKPLEFLHKQLMTFHET